MPNDTSKPSVPVPGRLPQFDLFPPRLVVPPNDPTAYVPPGPWLPTFVSTIQLDGEPDSDPPETAAQPLDESPSDPCEPVSTTPTPGAPRGRAQLVPLFTDMPYAWEESPCPYIPDDEEA